MCESTMSLLMPWIFGVFTVMQLAGLAFIIGVFVSDRRETRRERARDLRKQVEELLRELR